MASSKRRARLKLGALAVLLLLLGTLAYFVSKAAALNEDTIRADIVARLTAWSGTQVEVNGPIELHYFPDFAVTMGTMQIAETPRLPQVESITAQAIRVELGLRSLLLPEAILHRITLTDLDVTLPPWPKDASSQTDAGPLIDALRAMPVPEIVVVNGEINRKGERGRETFSGINVSAEISPAGAVRASGSMSWRKERLEFDLTSRLPDAGEPTATVPLALTLGGPLAGAEMEGQLMLANGVRATGSLSLQTPDLRRFTRWVGLLMPDGPGLRAFEASGSFRLTQQRLGFDEGTFVLDGNRALGALALDFGTARPLVSGTLAFSSFDVTPYLGKPAPPDRARRTPAKAPEMTDTSLLHHLDLDLRLSTSIVQAPRLTLGQAAVSTTVKAGRLMADFALLDLCNGNGNGRIDFDAAVPETAMKLSGNFHHISAQKCLQLAFGQAPLTGNFDIFVDAASKGRSWHDMLAGLEGRVDLESGPGSVALNLAALTNAERREPLTGWPALTGANTEFSDVRASLDFRKGHIATDNLRMSTAAFVYSGKGVIDTGDGAIDFTIAARNPSGESATGEPSPAVAPAIARLGGTWASPVVTFAGDTGTSAPGAAAPAGAPAPVR